MKSKNLKVDGKDHLFQLEESKHFCPTKKSTWHFLNFPRNAVWFLALANVALCLMQNATLLK